MKMATDINKEESLFCLASFVLIFGNSRCGGSRSDGPTAFLTYSFTLDYYRDNANYYSISGFVSGLYRDNGKENGNYYSFLLLPSL